MRPILVATAIAALFACNRRPASTPAPAPAASPKKSAEDEANDKAFHDAFAAEMQRQQLASARKPSVTTAQLLGDYRENELAGDNKWKGKRVRVLGVVRDVKKSVFGEPYVVLKGKGFLESVHCTFDRDTKVPVADIKKGSIILDGTVTGKTIESVMLKDCDWPMDDDVQANNPDLAKLR